MGKNSPLFNPHWLTYLNKTSYAGNQFRLFESSFGNLSLSDYQLSFSSIEEAKLIYEYGCSKFLSFKESLVSRNGAEAHAEFEAQLQYFLDLTARFSLALQAYVDSKGPFLTPKDDIASCVLQLHLMTTYIWLNIDKLPPGHSVGWEHFIPQVKEMILLGEKIIAFTSAGYEHASSFCLDMGYVIPIFHVASQCQESTIRRQAIALLRSTSRQEGLWNSILVAKAAERIMEIQEEDLQDLKGCVGGAKRSSIQPLLVIDKDGGRIRYTRQNYSAKGCMEEVVEEIFTW